MKFDRRINRFQWQRVATGERFIYRYFHHLRRRRSAQVVKSSHGTCMQIKHAICSTAHARGQYSQQRPSGTGELILHVARMKVRPMHSEMQWLKSTHSCRYTAVFSYFSELRSTKVDPGGYYQRVELSMNRTTAVEKKDLFPSTSCIHPESWSSASIILSSKGNIAQVRPCP